MNDETSKSLGGMSPRPTGGMVEGAGYEPPSGESVGARATGLVASDEKNIARSGPGIPDSVLGSSRDLYQLANNARARLKADAAEVKGLAVLAKEAPRPQGEPREDRGETIANIMLAYRHLEDASMRLGKALQSIDGGVSVYDRSTTVGA
jgi:hypothetical protein